MTSDILSYDVSSNLFKYKLTNIAYEVIAGLVTVSSFLIFYIMDVLGKKDGIHQSSNMLPNVMPLE